MRRQNVPACVRVICIAGLLVLGGCGAVGEWFKTDKTRFLSPSHAIRKTSRTPINPIYKGVSVVDTHRELFPNATRPTEDDYKYSKADYLIGPTDVLIISVLDLFQEGMETPLERQVSASGFIDLPLLPESYSGRIRAEGLNSEQLKGAIAAAYSPEVLRDPTISISIVAKRQSVFSIRGPVARPGTYSIVRKDMRLLEALALAGDVIQSPIKTIYIIRPRPAVPLEEDKREQPERGPMILPDLPEMPPGDGTAPGAQPATSRPGDVDEGIRELEGLVPGAPGRLDTPSILPMLSETASGAPSADPEALAREKGYKWKYLPGKDGQQGRWIRVATDVPAPAKPSPKPVRRPTKPVPRKAPPRIKRREDPYGWKNVDKSDMARIIAINLPKLNQGDPRMNIVIRDNDVIQIPRMEFGEFYVMGEVLRPSAYSLTGRQMTVKMAIAAAGNLGALAWPENSVLVRRIGDSQEQMIPLDIQAIIRGDDPDVFLKPNDVIMIGTDARASFFAVLRHAFRMSYGFGFIYDRNFSDPLSGRNFGYNSKRFTRL